MPSLLIRSHRRLPARKQKAKRSVAPVVHGGLTERFRRAATARSPMRTNGRGRMTTAARTKRISVEQLQVPMSPRRLTLAVICDAGCGVQTLADMTLTLIQRVTSRVRLLLRRRQVRPRRQVPPLRRLCPRRHQRLLPHHRRPQRHLLRQAALARRRRRRHLHRRRPQVA